MPRLFGHEDSESEPSRSYQTSKNSHSRKKYVEMDDLAVDYLPTTSRANLNQPSFVEVGDEHDIQHHRRLGNGSQKHSIRKTISIRQTTDV